MKVIIKRPPHHASPFYISKGIMDCIDYFYPWGRNRFEIQNSLADFLYNIPGVASLCEWINDLSELDSRESIRIDDHDVWGLDHTLSKIIAPSLRLLKEKKQGCPFVDEEDYPGDILISDDVDAEDLEYQGMVIRWEYVLDEMIYAFDSIRDDEYSDVYLDERVLNGLRLFAKYYFSLWD